MVRFFCLDLSRGLGIIAGLMLVMLLKDLFFFPSCWKAWCYMWAENAADRFLLSCLKFISEKACSFLQLSSVVVESFTGLKNRQACPELWVMVACSQNTEHSKEKKKKKAPYAGLSWKLMSVVCLLCNYTTEKL